MLHIATTAEECLASAEVRACLGEALRTHGTATLLVSSFADQLVVQKELSAYPALSLGVTVTTPVAWTKERWEVWGDGRSAGRCGETARMSWSLLRGPLPCSVPSRRLPKR